MDQAKAHFPAQHLMSDVHLVMLTGCFPLFVICAPTDDSGHVCSSGLTLFSTSLVVLQSAPLFPIEGRI